jgi:very-short-patch-repair endonuclease
MTPGTINGGIMDRPQIRANRQRKERALPRRRILRRRATKPEQLMWSILRRHRLGELKFRRQHSVGPYIVDFACVERRVIVEIDGGYHDYVVESDKKRQRDLEQLGWTVIRYSNDDLLQDLEPVFADLAKRLGVPIDG